MKTKALSFEDAQARRDVFYGELRQDLGKACREFDLSSTEVCFNIAQTYSRLDACLTENLLPSGLTLPGLNVLIILRKFRDAGCPLNALSHLLVVSRANITGLIDSLVRKGLVTRTEGAHDRRVIIARITKKGEALYQAYIPKHYGAMRGMVNALSKNEKADLIHLLTKLRRQLRRPRDR